MTLKIWNILLILTSLLGYLAWGEDQHAFLFQAEWEILNKFMTDPLSTLHPLIWLPLIAQGILVFTLFQRQPSRLLTLVGILGLGLLMVFLLLAGVLGRHPWIAISTLPFLAISVLVIRRDWFHKTRTESR